MIELIKTLILVLVPTGLIVWLVHNMLSKYFQQQQQSLLQSRSTENARDILKMKLQSYERLTLFMERIDIRHLILRIRMSQMSNQELQNALMVAVQQEFEHNQVQQLYVSDPLWEIVKTAKENILKLIMQQAAKLNPDHNSQELADLILHNFISDGLPSIETALKAIKQETRVLLQ